MPARLHVDALTGALLFNVTPVGGAVCGGAAELAARGHQTSPFSRASHSGNVTRTHAHEPTPSPVDSYSTLERGSQTHLLNGVLARLETAMAFLAGLSLWQRSC